MDIGQLDVVGAANEGAPMTLRHWATGEKTDVIIHVLGFDSDVVQEAERAEYKAMMGEEKEVELSDKIDRARLAKVKAAIVSIENLTDGGQQIKTGVDIAPYLDKPIGITIVEQVSKFASDRANLFPKPSTD
ncbi:MAG: hypothetical protein AAFR02_00590 [Pseudomonadota bacterium]